MSDCSTAAMLPKEQPRTCGRLIKNLRCIQENCRYERGGSITGTFHCYDVDGAFFDKCVDEVEALEQRCQQLEQVAREMFESIRDSWKEGEPVSKYNYLQFKKQLEALGVDVNAD